MDTKTDDFHSRLKNKMDHLVHAVYRVTKEFPKDELFGVTSQLRRAALSIVLNYVEGYARSREKVFKNFLEISYGSLQETRYLLEFSCKESYLTQSEFKILDAEASEIGAILWKMIKNREQ